ncbi:hypothetical protein ACI65C_008695 [Semiaphis heraclei]
MRVRAGLASLLTNAIPGCTDPCSGRRRGLSFVHSKSRPFPAEFKTVIAAVHREQRVYTALQPLVADVAPRKPVQSQSL